MSKPEDLKICDELRKHFDVGSGSTVVTYEFAKLRAKLLAPLLYISVFLVFVIRVVSYSLLVCCLGALHFRSRSASMMPTEANL